MKIETKKDLKEIIALCRKLGVQSFKADNVEFHLGDAPVKHRNVDDLIEDPLAHAKIPTFQAISQKEVNETGVKAIADKIASDELTEEQLLFYSSRPEAFEDKQEAQ